MLTFFPEFENGDGGSADQSLDVLFLVDCSNSMKESVTELKKLVLLAYQLLPENVRFNVVAFGEGKGRSFLLCDILVFLYFAGWVSSFDSNNLGTWKSPNIRKAVENILVWLLLEFSKVYTCAKKTLFTVYFCYLQI